MEDIYDDLNNYEDVNCVQELRKENMELKVKLEEHAAAMEKLQKDYDTLEMEFKKLESNYSSLLKTARAEIERKTQRIVQLNIDKDMMVLKSLKNGKNILRRNFNNKCVQNANKTNEKQTKLQGHIKADESIKLKNNDRKERYHTRDMQTEDGNIPNLGVDNRNSCVNKFDTMSAKPDTSYNRKSNVEEKPTHKTEYNNTPKIAASSIKNRRKSMPAVSMPVDNFNSGEENEHTHNIKGTKIDLATNNKFERVNINKIPFDRHSNKTSEASSIDDRGSNYHEHISKEVHRGWPSRHDNNAHRSRDKYSMKQRKDNSPEKGHKRQHSHREYPDNYYRQEQGRRRPRDSSPLDYDRYNRRNSDHRSNHDRHSDKYRHHYEEKYGKQRMSNNYDHDDEPRIKRQKTEYFRHPDVQVRENREHYYDKDFIDMQSMTKMSPHEYDILRVSCQSPDFINYDAAFAGPIKEIKATASTSLEDPRITSKRYETMKDNGREILSAVASRNTDIKPVNKAKWNIIIPDALVRRPPSRLASYEIVKNIDVDINSPEADFSLESGEVRFESDIEGHETSEKAKDILHNIQDAHISKPEYLSKQPVNVVDISKPNVAKYRIPKIGKTNQGNMDVPIIHGSERFSEPCNQNATKKVVQDEFMKMVGAEDCTKKVYTDNCTKKLGAKDCTKKVSAEDCTKKVSADDFTKKGADDVTKKIATSRKNDERVNPHTNDNLSKRENKENNNEVRLSKMAIVADDLELSDDNSDNVDTHKHNMIAEKVKRKCNVQPNVIVIPKDHLTSNHSDNIANTNKTNETVNATDNETTTMVDMGDKINIDSSKKQKNKKKRNKSKELSKDLVEGINPVPTTEKKTKSKKDKDSKPKETKTKFSDLFGDSSSLMTPEDLGIPSYLPISEDTQDAVDIKINQIIDASPIVEIAEKNIGNNTQNIMESKKQDQGNSNNTGINSQNSNTDNKDVTHNTKYKKALNRNEETVENDISLSDIYENLNPETDSNDPDIVKTVVISTGVQPEIMLENNSEVVHENPNVEVHTKQSITESGSLPAIIDFKRQDMLKALATSTPHKECTILNPVANAGTNSIASKKNESGDSTTPVVNQSVMNMLDSQDAPDVRIFVKRRRKLMKRPPMT